MLNIPGSTGYRKTKSFDYDLNIFKIVSIKTEATVQWQGRSVQILKTGPWTWEWHLVHGPSCFLEVYSRMFHSHSILLQSIHSTQCFTHCEISPPFPPTIFNFLWSVFYDSLYFSTYYLDSVNLPLLGRTSVFSVKVKTLQQVDAPQLDASDPFPFLFDGENMDGRPETKLAAFPASQLVDGTRSTVSSNLNGCLECSPLIRVPAYIEFCPPNNYSAF